MDLIQLKEKSEEKKRLERLINTAKRELSEQKNKLTDLTSELKKEHDDVKRLEGAGLTSMFYSFMGNKVERLEKERQEYLAARLKYDTCKNEIEHIEIEIDKLNKQVGEIGNPDADYQKLLEEKKQQHILLPSPEVM